MVFKQANPGCMLVGGTALAGFYAGHRRSDDIDLFCADDFSQKVTLLAVQQLKKEGAELFDERHSAHYYRSSCVFEKHLFTIDIVLDSNLFKVGQALCVEKNINVATLETLLKTKCATLISRCSEKDLFDLLWLHHHFQKITTELVLREGSLVDSGINAESLLLSVAGTNLSEESCGFCDNLSSAQVLAQITEFQKNLVSDLELYLSQQTDPHLEKIFKRFKKLSGR